MSLKGKNILVVGGSSGIGLSLITSLANNGAEIYTLSRSSAETWPATVKYHFLDVLESSNDLGNFLPEQLHGLVYCVGNINLKPFSRVNQDELVNDFRLNVVGAAMVIQQALKSLKNAGGASVVLISSVAAKVGMPFHASTAASKAALEGLAVSLAAEFANLQIRVNVVAPSLTDTPLAEKLLNTPEKKEVAGKRHPLGRFGLDTDIARSISFLLDDQSSWITGQTLGVDGGMSTLKTNL